VAQLRVAVLNGTAPAVPSPHAPRSERPAAPATRATTRTSDPRYSARRWSKVAKRILRRDGWVCRIVADCPTPATVADHIIPVFPGMPDSLFFGEDNLRAGCRDHNLARGHAARLEEVRTPESTSVVRGDYTRRDDG